MSTDKKPRIISLGDIAWDFLLETPQGLFWGSDVPGRVEFSYGGSACNFAVWASRCGAKIRLLGKVGKDLLGELMLQHLKEEGVEFPLSPVPGARTARIGVLVSSNGERAMVMDKDPHLAFSPEDFAPQLFEGYDLLFFTGYTVFNRSSVNFLRRALSHARKIGILIAFDPSSFHLMEEFGHQELIELVTPLDFLMLNEEEALIFAGGEDFSRLLAFAKAVVIKRGAGGATALWNKEEFSLPALPAPVSDTTGAGDAFDAGFLVSFLQCGDIKQALEEGNRLGAYVVSHFGAQPPIKGFLKERR
ncbi:MAG: carbohydrate kinase family protein [bacterium]